MLKGQEEIEVLAPVVISNAGIFNTLQKFLPRYIQDKPGDIMLLCGLLIRLLSVNILLHFSLVIFSTMYFLKRVCVEIQSLLKMVHHGMGSFLVFVGLDGSKEELGIVSTNFWMYKDNDLNSL